MSAAAIEALKAEILAECGVVDPTVMDIIERGNWRVHLTPATKSELETADQRRRREIEILTSFTYDDLRAKLTSMLIEEAAADLGVSVELIKEYRGLLGVFPRMGNGHENDR